MANYIALIDFTEQGIRAIKDSPGRLAEFRLKAESLGATVKAAYWTSGVHDGVLIVDAPDEKIASALFLSLAQAGNVRTLTLRAYDEAEMQEILTKSE